MNTSNTIRALCRTLRHYENIYMLNWISPDEVDITSRTEKSLDNPQENIVYWTYKFTNLQKYYKQYLKSLKKKNNANL